MELYLNQFTWDWKGLAAAIHKSVRVFTWLPRQLLTPKWADLKLIQTDLCYADVCKEEILLCLGTSDISCGDRKVTNKSDWKGIMPEMMMFLYLLMCIQSSASSVQHPLETQLHSPLSYSPQQEHAARFHKGLSELNCWEMLEINILHSTFKI